MYIRFKTNKTKTLLYAVLVKSEREDDKIKQKIIAYLASIRKVNLNNVVYVDNFQTNVENKIDTVNIPDSEKQELKKEFSLKLKKHANI